HTRSNRHWSSDVCSSGLSRSHDIMAFSVQMPALGESVSEGTITRWLKKEGDTVEVDEPLLEVSTDKVDTEIPSPAAGTLQKIVEIERASCREDEENQART